MNNKYGNPPNFLCALILMFGMMLGNFQAGKAQSETDFSAPVNVSASGIASNPVSVVDFYGVIHVIWVDKIDGYKYSRTENGTKWTDPITVKFPFSVKDSPPVLLADPIGFIHIFWIDEEGRFFYAQSLSENFGEPASWIFTTLSSGVANFDVVVDINGMMHLAYIENITNKTATAGVYYSKSMTGSGFWSSPVMLYRSEYFRGSLSTSASIRIAASNQIIGQTLYITWDNRPQKRIFISASVDAGKTWAEARQFMGPEDTGVYGSPFNFSIWAKDQNLLLMWQIGEPGAAKCSVYSQWSQDTGKSFGDVFQLFGGPITCPTHIKFITSQSDKVAVLLSAEPSISLLLAWNGSEWSNPLPQTELPILSNPDTYDTILLGCRQDLFFKDNLFVIGCDQAHESGDIWFVSRPLIPLDEWFSPVSIWSEPLSVDIDGQDISSIASAVDGDGSMHIVWVQGPTSQGGTKPSIQYSRWNGNDWSAPEPIIRDLDGTPLQLTMYISQKRLMLVWVDGSSGDLSYTWVNLDQANQLSKWEAVVVLPSPSTSNNAPDVVVDSSGRIVVAYAVPINENRGVYITQSIDNGASWLSYNLAFDAVAAKWESIDMPKIALDGDGVLHLLFTRQSRWTDQLVGLYYSQSKDAGVTWSDPQPVSNGKILWSDLVTFDQHTVHLVWQEDNGLVVANLSQVSLDGGATWSDLLDVTGVGDQPSSVSLATNGVNLLHFIQISKAKSTQLAEKEALFLFDSKWDGNRWNPVATREIKIRGNSETQYAVTAGITVQNYLGVFLTVESFDTNGVARDEVINLRRFLEFATNQDSPVDSVLPTSVPALIGQPVALEATSTPVIDLSVLYESNDPSEGVVKNLIGLILIGIVLIVTIVLFARRKPYHTGQK